MIQERNRLQLIADMRAVVDPKALAKLAPMIQRIGGDEVAAKFALQSAGR